MHARHVPRLHAAAHAVPEHVCMYVYVYCHVPFKCSKQGAADVALAPAGGPQSPCSFPNLSRRGLMYGLTTFASIHGVIAAAVSTVRY